MANFVLTPNMSLVQPDVGVEPGPQYAQDINNSLSIVDGHNHSPGYGVQITPSGLNINSDLPFGVNNATLLRSVRFQPQPAALSLATDIGCLYETGVDLYYNDGSGNQIQITKSGGVNATSSGISSGTASAGFVAGVLVVDSASLTPANIQVGSVLLGLNMASTNYLTLSPPSSLASGSYSLTLPAIPSVLSSMTLDSSGNMGSITFDQVGENMTSVGADAIAASMDATGANAIGATMTATGANAVANTRTRTVSSTAPLGGVAASGNFSGNTTSTSLLPLAICALNCSGNRPVWVGMACQTANCSTNGIGTGGYILIYRNGSYISSGVVANDAVVPVSAYFAVDVTAPAGTNTYELYIASVSGQYIGITNGNLIAYEL